MTRPKQTWLSTGEHGVRADVPEGFEWVPDGGDVLRYLDPSLAVEYRFLYFPNLHMDLSEPHRDRLRLDVEGPARVMFEQVHRQTASDEEPLRTDDASWSPIIDVDFEPVSGDVTGLRLVHRMIYRPGAEVIMGHWLVPLEDGLFEARLITANGSEPTGLRESAVMMMSDDPDAFELGGDSRAKQRTYDDPRHDETFASHPLTRVRKALAECRGALHIERPGGPIASTRRVLSEPACSVVPPPRFFDAGDGIQRVTFCGTDGLQFFEVERLPDGRGTPSLESVGREHAEAVHREHAVENVRLASESLPLDDERELVVVRVDGDGHAGPLQNTMAYFRAADSIWSFTITSTLHGPADAIAADLAESARSLEAAPRKKKRFGIF